MYSPNINKSLKFTKYPSMVYFQAFAFICDCLSNKLKQVQKISFLNIKNTNMKYAITQMRAKSPTMYTKNTGKSFLSAKNLCSTPKSTHYWPKYDLNQSNPQYFPLQQSPKMDKLTSWTEMSCKSSDKSQLLKSIVGSKTDKPAHSKKQLPFKKCNFSINPLFYADSEKHDFKIRQSISTLPQTPKSQKIVEKIDEYSIIKLLDKGRFGSVYLARHIRSGWIGALKVLQKKEIEALHLEKKQKIKSQIFSQIKIQFCLSHPNLIKLYDFFADQTHIYMFLQLAEEGHLFNFIQKQSPISQESTSIIIREITNGLKYMHSKDVFHRDLKLQNIVFTNGMAKICDFGWSIHEPKHLRTTLCGTPLYLSPQILQGKQYDNKIDIWALGTIAYQLFTNQNPFKINSPKQLRKIITNQFTMDKGSPQIRSFIKFILKKNPQRRPDAEIILLHPFITKYQQIETSEQICSISH